MQPTYTPKPRYNIDTAATLLAMPITSLEIGLDWARAHMTGSDFAQSVIIQYDTSAELTARQWQAIVNAAQGKGAPRRMRRAKPVVQDDAVQDDAAQGDTAPVKNKPRPLAPIARSIVKKAVTSHGDWPDYAKGKGMNASHIVKDNLFSICDDLGIDVDNVLSGHNDKAKLAAAPAPQVTNGSVDWERVRAIAKSEVERRMQPTIVDRIVIDQGKLGKKAVNAGEIVHPNFHKAMAALCCTDFSGNYLSVMLVGPAGTGKSYACRQIAKALGLEFYFHSVALESYDLAGYEKLNGEQKLTAFIKAFSEGGLVLLDELDSYDPKAVVVINAALANGEIALSDGTILKRHKEFRCVAACNTTGLGATGDYTAREKLDLSTLSRFAVRIDWYADAAIEAKIAESKAGDIGAAWCREVQAAREAFKRLDLPMLADQRAIEAGAALIAQGMPIETVRELTYESALDADQISAVRSAIDSRALCRI